MGAVRKIELLSLLIVVALFARNVSAESTDTVSHGSSGVAFGVGGSYTIVDCGVHERILDDYAAKYGRTRKTSNRGSVTPVSFSPEPILKDVNAWTPSVDGNSMSGFVDTAFWTVADSSAQNIDCLLADTIDSKGGSSLLGDVNYYEPSPVWATGTLLGRNVSASEDYLPMPTLESAALARINVSRGY